MLLDAVIASGAKQSSGKRLDVCSTCPWIASSLLFEVGYSRLRMALLAMTSHPR
jgi:hypothetical protein